MEATSGRLTRWYQNCNATYKGRSMCCSTRVRRTPYTHEYTGRFLQMELHNRFFSREVEGFIRLFCCCNREAFEKFVCAKAGGQARIQRVPGTANLITAAKIDSYTELDRTVRDYMLKKPNTRSRYGYAYVCFERGHSNARPPQVAVVKARQTTAVANLKCVGTTMRFKGFERETANPCSRHRTCHF